MGVNPLYRRRVKWCPFAGSGLLTADVLAEAAKRLWGSGTLNFSSWRLKSWQHECRMMQVAEK